MQMEYRQSRLGCESLPFGGLTTPKRVIMTKRLVYLCLFLFIVLAACGDQKKDNNAQNIYPYSQELPLRVGNSWTYKVTRYEGFNSDDMMTVSSTMTDSVSHFETNGDFLVATIQSVRSAEVLVDLLGNYPVTNSLQPTSTVTYWLIVDGNRVLRQDDKLNLSDIQSQVLVEYVFPINLDSQWSISNAKDAPLNQKITKAGSITVPAGTFTGCFYLEGDIGGMTFNEWFCPGIGMVWYNAEHHGTPFGSRQELVSYKVK
jgi:hypothetical protein